MTNTPYLIKLSPMSFKQIQALSGKDRQIIIKTLEALSVNPHPPDAQKIEGMTGLYSEEINQQRLIYKVEEQEVLLLLIK